ncbi:MAG TPA: hypothetical protein VF174_04960 [Micromonosporaceae bacterium]
MRAIRITIIAALTGALLAGCGQAESGAPPTGSGAESMTSPTQPGADPTPTTPAPTPSTPVRPTGPSGAGVPPVNESPTPGGGQPGAPIVLTGTIREGVEQGCLLLDDYLLVGGPRDVLRAGARVVVTGHPDPNLMTTCMQGTPFLVARAQPA